MASIIQKAAKGDRKAMQLLYSENKSKVYSIARFLLLDESQASAVTGALFREIFSELKSAQIGSEEGFTIYALTKAAGHCKVRLTKKNPKALRLPANRNFALAQGLAVKDAAGETDFYLTNLPALQRFILVMHTAGGWNAMQLARALNIDSGAVQAAMEAEKANFQLLQQLSGKGCCTAYEQLVADITACRHVVSEEVDKHVQTLIDSIAGPAGVKAKKDKKRNSILAAVACVAAVAIIAAIVIACLPGPVYYADIQIQDYGTVTVQLDADTAPITCENFVSLAESGFYNGLTFHRIIEGFMMQGGDPEGNGTGGSDKDIIGEFSANGYDNDLSHVRGVISMARSDDYNSGSSQFFIVQEDSTHLDGQYAAFGWVIEGMDIVDAICADAEPIDGNGLIAAEAQPVITAITIRTEK